jgi:hypothetical protein
MGYYNHEEAHCARRPGQAVLPVAGMKKPSYKKNKMVYEQKK